MERDNTGIKHNNNSTIPDKWAEKKRFTVIHMLYVIGKQLI